MKLSEIPVSDIFIGMKLISAVGNPGQVIAIDIDPRYKEDDDEKNPCVTIEWYDGHRSIVSPAFMGKISVNEYAIDAERYRKLRRWMGSNVQEGWNEVENLGALACYMGWDEFDDYLDQLPVCNVGLCHVREE